MTVWQERDISENLDSSPFCALEDRCQQLESQLAEFRLEVSRARGLYARMARDHREELLNVSQARDQAVYERDVLLRVLSGSAGSEPNSPVAPPNTPQSCPSRLKDRKSTGAASTGDESIDDAACSSPTRNIRVPYYKQREVYEPMPSFLVVSPQSPNERREGARCPALEETPADKNQ